MAPVHEIRITFGAAVDLTDDQVQGLIALASWISDTHMGRNPGRVMWPAGVGALMTRHPMSLSDDEPIPFDDDVFHVECAEREAFAHPCAVCGEPQEDHGPFAPALTGGKACNAYSPAPPLRDEAATALAWGRPVRRAKGSYKGPGRVRGWARTEAGQHRVIVGHVIEGGEGELLHIYSPLEIAEV